MKKVILPSLAWTAGLSLLIALILHLGGDFPDLRSYVQPRLGVGVLVFLIVSLGLFSVFDKAFLKKFFPWAAVLPILWMATFTWAYGFASLPEKKHLGDYYVLGGVAFGLPYVYLTITEKINQRLPKLRFLWELIAGLFAFFMTICPFIYIGYYILFGGEMDMFAMMAVRSTHMKETMISWPRWDRLSESSAPSLPSSFVLAVSFTFVHSMVKAARGMKSPLRGTSKGYLIGLGVLFVLFFGGFYRQIIHVFPITIVRTMDSKGSEFQLLQKLTDNLDKNVKKMTFVDPGAGITEGTHIVIIGESANRRPHESIQPVLSGKHDAMALFRRQYTGLRTGLHGILELPEYADVPFLCHDIGQPVQ